MGTETFKKAGARSRKRAADKPGVNSRKANRFQYCEPLSGGPEPFERKLMNRYRKTSLPNQDDSPEGYMY